jgi:hypothetical protein
MQPNEKKIWFPAKKYGWGWGPPVCWQGWAVLIGYLVLDATGVCMGIFFLPQHLEVMVAALAILTLALVAILRLKGEPPRWRWGGK